ncbi:MAG: globin domain-containing protein [Cyclobacteriaceae bacterium]
MTKDQINLVEKSWDFVVLNTNEAGMIFYGKLFELDPSLRHLFKGDLTQQSRKLVSMITFIVHKLNNLSEVTADIVALGKRHAKYNVEVKHFDTVALALLQTLELALQEQWDEKMKDAWTTVYKILSGAMIDAMKEVDTVA